MVARRGSPGAVLDAVTAGSSAVTEILFYATHTLGAKHDRALMRQYQGELPASARLWVLLYDEKRSEDAALDRNLTLALGVSVYRWGESALHRLYPKLGHAAHTDPGLHTERSYHKRLYYTFHASLGLWNASYGHAFPNLQYWWRIEMDALFAGSMGTMIQLAARDDASVLLPKYTTRKDSPSYHHWSSYPHGTNEGIFAGLPEKELVFSLVSIGRYSSRFLSSMAERWAAGIIGYEEILLPVTCRWLNHSSRWPCRTAAFHASTSLSPAHFRFRPDHSCEDYLAARKQGEGGVWHPVKLRACIVQSLETLTPGSVTI